MKRRPSWRPPGPSRGPSSCATASPSASAAGVLALLIALFVWLGHALPISRALEPLPNRAIILLDSQGQPFARRGAYKEAPVVIDALPKHVPAAFLAIEDRRFYHHLGVDFRGMARAARANAKAGRTVEGGSTITQQLAKNAFLKPERSLRRKAQEAVIAVYLELRLSKDEILARYLSSIYFGDGVYGLGAAARHYFGKPPEALSIGEAAMLAGMAKAPVDLDPVDHPKAAGDRARLVLEAMVQTKAITRQQADASGRSSSAPLAPTCRWAAISPTGSRPRSSRPSTVPAMARSRSPPRSTAACSASPSARSPGG
jgi:penicillin-binding protein 1A